MFTCSLVIERIQEIHHVTLIKELIFYIIMEIRDLNTLRNKFKHFQKVFSFF